MWEAVGFYKNLCLGQREAVSLKNKKYCNKKSPVLIIHLDKCCELECKVAELFKRREPQLSWLNVYLPGQPQAEVWREKPHSQTKKQELIRKVIMAGAKK